jgi:predicted hotdog family 3-hydroxylacyl-ACP dehydratase
MTAKDELDRLLPHRSPMTLLAEAFPEKTPGTAEAVADTSDGCLFYDHAVGGVPACVALEYMAQTMALAVGRERLSKGADPAVGFVLGTRRMDVSVVKFARDARYVARAECTYTDAQFASFDCDIRDDSGKVVASATLTAFQPDEEELKEMTK